MSHYDRLLSELRAAEQRQRPAPDFDPGSLADHQREFGKALGDIHASLGRLAPRPAQPLTVRDRRRQVGRVMAKAFDAYRAGEISGEQLRAFEARHHIAVDELAQRGAL